MLAASSLDPALGAVAARFEAAHDGVAVELGFDGSSTLATQIVEGAPGDVFASADEANLTRVRDAGLAGPAVPFATNELVIVVPTGNPAGVRDLHDLTRPGLRVALCGPEVPCGRYAGLAFDRARVAGPVASAEPNVRAVLTKVALGEADAGIAYATDALGDAAVDAIDLPTELQVPVTYHVGVLQDAPNPAAATSFAAFLTGPAAQAILRDAGFGPP